MAHYYRGEIARMAGWRDRIDRTTNWAVTVVAAMLSISLSNPTANHSVLLFACLVVLPLLYIESRRYRFLDVYRNRVRKVERNYYSRVFDIDADPDEGWLRSLSCDLRDPKFPIGRLDAFSRRLRRNYIWLFTLLLLAWLFKISGAQPVEGAIHFGAMEQIRNNASVGGLDGIVVLVLTATFYAGLISLVFVPHRSSPEVTSGGAHV